MLADSLAASQPYISCSDTETTSVAIVGYRNAEDIWACVEALAKSTDTNFSISICENGGLDGYNALVAKLADTLIGAPSNRTVKDPLVSKIWEGELTRGKQKVRLYLAEKNLGYAGGVNLCIRNLESLNRWSAVWILNPDTIPDPGALEALVKRAKAGGYSVVGSRLVFDVSNRIQMYGGRWRRIMARGLNLGLNEPMEAVPNFDEIERCMDYVCGASLFATKEFIEQIGMMDERYFLYCEEVDWCLRRGNLRLGYAHDSIVIHKHGATIGSASKLKDRSSLSVFLSERNKLLLSRRFYPIAYPIIVLATLVLTTQYLAGGAYRNFLVSLRGWFAGLCGKEGAPNATI